MATKGKKKNFVLDTNVMLHDYECIEKFEENDIYIPIVSLEELDKFKKGTEQINFNARAFARRLDEISDQDLFKKGASLGEDRGRLFVKINGQSHEKVREAFGENIADHRILSIAMTLADEQPKTKTILVTKDVNLRLKARSLGMLVEDYINDKATRIDLFNDSETEYEGVDADLIDRMYSSNDGISRDEWDMSSKIEPNDCFVMKSERNSILARYNPFTDRIIKIEKKTYFGIQPRNAEQSFAMNILTDPDVKLIGLTGKAGTGKTLLALAAALSQEELYKQILLARPIVSLANKDLGFLPGDEKAKVAPYMQPLFDNLNVIKGQFAPNSSELQKLQEMQKSEKLVIEALAYIRGRSVSETIFIIDEAQNLTPHEIKTIVTRAGEGSKLIFTGDIEQIDSPYLDAQSNGLAYMIERMKGEPIFAHINLIKGERSQLSELASNLL